MYTDPEIVTGKDMSSRSYVKVYIDGVRHRFYNGKALSPPCYPNNCKTLKERNRALSTLAFQVRKALEEGWRPGREEMLDKPVQVRKGAGECIEHLLSQLSRQPLSTLYKRDINQLGTAFLQFLKKVNCYALPVTQLSSAHIEPFLRQYDKSATYYMNKRRTLGGIFSRLVNQKILSENPVYNTVRQKEKSTLHQAYNREQLHKVLAVLQEEHPNLHLCALLMYGCFLRPHQEIRSLCRSDLNEDGSSIALSGEENKSGRIRSVFVPSYVRDVFVQRELLQLHGRTNLFTGEDSAYNESYFNTAWSRVKEKMLEKGLVGKDHTLYSFRHTAAINLYMKTKDLYKVQQAMGHSSMVVTLTYMRSLGVVNAASPDDVPDL